MTTAWPAPDQLFINEKPGIRYYLIMAALSQLPPEVDQQAYHQEALKIRNTFDEQIIQAKKYQEEGNITLAVSVYEQLVKDGYDQIYPYTYLKEYYMAIGEGKAVQQNIKAFGELVEGFQKNAINRPDLIAFLRDFV